MNNLSDVWTGNFGILYKAKDKKTNKFIGLKKIKILYEQEGLSILELNKISLLKSLNNFDHPNLIKILDICHGKTTKSGLIYNTALWLIFEYSETNLCTYIKENTKINNCIIKRIMKDILLGISFLHNLKIIHRDLKPKNLFLIQDRIKIGDFGLSKIYNFENFLNTDIDNLPYEAPEILSNKYYDYSSDIWSIGCIFAELYILNPLFYKKNKEEIIEISKNLYVFLTEKTNIKNVELTLLTKMLSLNPKVRISAKECLEHNYFNEY